MDAANDERSDWQTANDGIHYGKPAVYAGHDESTAVSGSNDPTDESKPQLHAEHDNEHDGRSPDQRSDDRPHARESGFHAANAAGDGQPNYFGRNGYDAMNYSRILMHFGLTV